MGDYFTDSIDSINFANIRGISSFNDTLTLFRNTGNLVSYTYAGNKTTKY